MDLTALAKLLRQQAQKNSTLVLDETVFADGSVRDNLRLAFDLPDGQSLTIVGVHASDIPDPANGTLHTLQVSAGTISVLKQKHLAVGLRFTESSGVLDAVISVEMGSHWKFSDSFPGLDQLFPFEDLAVSGARFVYATSQQTGFSWPGDESSFKIDLEEGLNFLSELSLLGFPAIGQLLEGLLGDPSYKFYGPFSPADQEPLPVGEIRAPVSQQPFKIGTVELGVPAVAVRIDKALPQNPLQRIALEIIADYKKSFEFSVGIPIPPGKTLSIEAKEKPGASLADLPLVGDFKARIPTKFEKALEAVRLDDFLMMFDLDKREVTYVSLQVGTTSSWPDPPDKVLTLEGLGLRFEIIDPKGLNLEQVVITAEADFLPKIFKGEFDFEVSLKKSSKSSWEMDTISGAYFGAVSLGDIVAGLDHGKAPEALEHILFSNFGVSASRVGAQDPFDYTFWGSVEAAFPISGQELTAHLGITVGKTAAATTLHLNGQLVVGSEAFTLQLDLAKADSRVEAHWKSLGDPLEFADIAEAFGFTSVPKIPPDLDLALEEAWFSYDFTKKILVLSATSKNYGTAVFLADRETASAPIYAFGINVPLDVNFGEVPVIGKKIPDAKDFAIKDPGVWVLSGPISAKQAGELNAKIRAGDKGDAPNLPVLPEQDLTARVLLSGDLELGPSYQKLLELELGSTAGSPPPSQFAITVDLEEPPPSPPAAKGGVTPPKSSPDGAKWIDIKKSIGPLDLQRMGLKYADSQLYFLIDMGFSAGGLTIDLSGLGMSSKLTKFTPEFHLSGLELEYKASAFEIAGEFLNIPKEQLPKGTLYEYAGAATLKAGSFELSALGSYAKLPQGPSLFVFAVLEVPLGGPPFFFVTGAAAGFGYNRNLVLPPVEQVPNFPLVAAAMDPSKVFPTGSNQTNSLSQALGILEKYIPPEAGEYWLAAGIRFTSFEMLSSFALLSVGFGNRLEIALLGETQLSLPPDPTGDKPNNPKIANVEMAIEVLIEPDAGDFKASAVLTQNSWLLASSCRLTGGFAFYIWFGDNPHSGDFVVTLGGYNPHYQPNKWYPNEPRLGLDWQLSTVLSIKGGCYFALTPHAVMAGGGLQVLFQTGPLRAWLTAYADFLIEWQPFFYEIDAGVSVGVSLTLDLFGLKISVTLEVGATLDLWGPPFGGKATIHLWIISFTIHFGDQTKAPKPLSFDDFNRALLPKGSSAAPNQPPAKPVAGFFLDEFDARAKEPPIFIKPSFAAGVLDSPTSNKALAMPIVSARALEIRVASNWPATRLDQLDPVSHAGAAVPDSTEAPRTRPKSIFEYKGDPKVNPDGHLYVNPMHGVTPFTAELSVEVVYHHPNGDLVATDRFVCTPILKNAPSAVWGSYRPEGPKVNPPGGALTIPGVPFGIAMRAVPETLEDAGKIIPLECFASETDWICVSWPYYPTAKAAVGDAIEKIKEIADPALGATRQGIRSALAAALGDEHVAGLPAEPVFSAELTEHPDDVFLAPPRVARLGQLPSGNDRKGVPEHE